jgi:hypothetical protein
VWIVAEGRDRSRDERDQRGEKSVFEQVLAFVTKIPGERSSASSKSSATPFFTNARGGAVLRPSS